MDDEEGEEDEDGFLAPLPEVLEANSSALSGWMTRTTCLFYCFFPPPPPNS